MVAVQLEKAVLSILGFVLEGQHGTSSFELIRKKIARVNIY